MIVCEHDIKPKFFSLGKDSTITRLRMCTCKLVSTGLDSYGVEDQVVKKQCANKALVKLSASSVGNLSDFGNHSRSESESEAPRSVEPGADEGLLLGCQDIGRFFNPNDGV